MAEICRDLNQLDPTFKPLVEELLRRMELRGWKPLVWETYRSPERARELAARGTSKNGDRSMHCLGLAVDIVDSDFHNVGGKEGYWNAPDKFWADLGDIATELKLVRLYKPGVKYVAGNNKDESWDKPHVQVITVAEQNKVRAMTPEKRAVFVKVRLS